MVLRKLVTCKGMKLEHFLTPYTKINSKWIQVLNVRPETIKLLEENIGKSLWHKSQQDPLWPTSQNIGNKAKINKWDLIKLKNFCTTKETISKVKRQPSEREKIIANEATDKQLNLKNILATYAAQFQKNKWLNQKMGQRTK